MFEIQIYFLLWDIEILKPYFFSKKRWNYANNMWVNVILRAQHVYAVEIHIILRGRVTQRADLEAKRTSVEILALPLSAEWKS